MKNERSNETANDLENGQQGAGGFGGLSKRTTPDPAGSQPQLGGANEPGRIGAGGTGMTEHSDPMSREGLPHVADHETPNTDNTDPDSKGESNSKP